MYALESCPGGERSIGRMNELLDNYKNDDIYIL